MKRTIYDVLEELQTDFRDLEVYLNEDNKQEKDLKRIVKSLINEFMIPELEELSELLDDDVIEKQGLDWFKYDESDDLEEAIKYNIAVNCEQRLNGYYDDCVTELYDKEDWYKYIFDLTQGEWHQNGFIFTDDRISKFTKIYGHDNVKALIKLWVDNYEDVKPYIKW